MYIEVVTMSLVIAVKKDGKVFFGADTQTTIGDGKKYSSFEEEYKIMNLGNGVVVGLSGYVSSIQQLTFHPEWFSDLETKTLTKKFLVTDLLPKLFKELSSYEQLTITSNGAKTLSMSIIIAKADRLFRIYDSGAVVEIPHFVAIGSGQSYALAFYRVHKPFEDVNQFIVNAIAFTDGYVESVGGDITLMDTHTLKIEKRSSQLCL